MDKSDFERKIEIISSVLAEEYKPQTIFLFGSYAWGIPDEQSDIDICVILKESNQSQVERIRQGLRALLHHHINLDLLVFTEAEFVPRATNPSTLAYQISHKGVKLYEAARRMAFQGGS